MPLSKNTQTKENQQPQTPNRKKRDAKKIQPLLTPMIDVTFLLLLYFLLTSTFRKDEGQLPASLPGGHSHVTPRAPMRPVLVAITADGNLSENVVYTVDNNRPTSSSQALFLLLEKRSKMDDVSEQPVIIRADSFARWEYVVEAYNAVLRAKYRNIAFAGYM